ncbi:MAG: helix-turn-helix domain-containing protein [Bryobacteraceae bacterium]|nr:helix-turn-helix domain-containing protein [Bryobacteraceae bacterium]
MANRKTSPKQAHRPAPVSLGSIAETTKISPIFLAAIEKQDFGKLPGGVFDRNYIRQYASAAGLDAGPILASYEIWLAGRQQEPAVTPRPEPLSSPLKWLLSLVTSSFG